MRMPAARWHVGVTPVCRASSKHRGGRGRGGGGGGGLCWVSWGYIRHLHCIMICHALRIDVGP